MIVLIDKLCFYGFSIVLMAHLINSTISFIKFQTSYCPILFIFRSRTSMNKLNNVHKNCLCLVTNNYDSNFNEWLEWSLELSIHKTSINYIVIEVYKYLHGLSPELMSDIFTLRKNSYNIRNIFLLYSYKYICNTNNL